MTGSGVDEAWATGTQLAVRKIGYTPVTVDPAKADKVTLAATPEQVERIVFASEYGTLWLAAEDEEAPEPVTPVRTSGNIYE